MSHQSDGEAALEELVEGALETTREASEDAPMLLEKYADALSATAVLPNRRKEWVTWARREATRLRMMAFKLTDRRQPGSGE